jgi:O-acetyl-ADP-ribose deacetylase (regulator of RNase III)
MTITITQGNITYSKTDAIVNAANSALREGGGVCGAIFKAVEKLGGLKAHQQLTQACRDIGHCPTGDAVIAPSFALAAPFIIHAVGPVWNGREKDDLVAPLNPQELKQADELAAAYRAVLRVCRENNLKSVTIPGISTGIFGFPKNVAAIIAKQVCEAEAGDIEVNLISYEDDSLIELRTAPTAEGIALLNGHQF